MTEHKMTEEIRRALLSRVPFSVGCTIDYTPPNFLTKIKDKEGKDTEQIELPSEFIPVFSMSSLSKADISEAEKKIDDITESVDRMRDITRRNVKGWRNFYDTGTTKLIEYKADVNGGADKDIFDKLPLYVVSNMYMFLLEISCLREVDRSGL